MIGFAVRRTSSNRGKRPAGSHSGAGLASAPEIAAAMLQRQQATAVVAARQQIVDAAVGIVEHALDELSRRNVIELDVERKAAMVSNLMVVLCGHSNPQPVLNTGRRPAMPRKPFLLRIDEEVLVAVQRWAEEDLRSLNGQIEYLLRQALTGRGVNLKGPAGGRPDSTQANAPRDG